MYDDRRYVEEILPIEVLVGKTLTKIWNKDEQELIFYTTDGEVYSMTNIEQNSIVYLDKIYQDMDYLIGEPILSTDKSIHEYYKGDFVHWYEKQLDSFFELSTKKGTVYIKWRAKPLFKGDLLNVDFYKLDNIKI